MGTYHSTRGRTLSCSSKVAIRTGIAPDGGLFVSDELGTQQVDISSLADKSYFEIAQDVLGMLLNDYTAEEISACVDEAYRGTFASEEVTPLVKLDAAPGADVPQTYVMELFGGGAGHQAGEHLQSDVLKGTRGPAKELHHIGLRGVSTRRSVEFDERRNLFTRERAAVCLVDTRRNFFGRVIIQ